MSPMHVTLKFKRRVIDIASVDENLNHHVSVFRTAFIQFLRGFLNILIVFGLNNYLITISVAKIAFEIIRLALVFSYAFKL